MKPSVLHQNNQMFCIPSAHVWSDYREFYNESLIVNEYKAAGLDWRKNPDSSGKMFKVFTIMTQLHELLWYLTEGLNAESSILDL